MSVITLTHARRASLERALASVAAQEGVRVEHVVVADRCEWLGGREHATLVARFPSVKLLDLDVSPTRFDYLPARLGHLRNQGLAHASADLVAYLDDDNAYRAGHLASLAAALAVDDAAEVAYSWRRLLDPEGNPFTLEREDPWDVKPWRRARTYARARRLGIYTDGSCVVRDALLIGTRMVARVDTSELMVRRTLHERLPWPTEFSPAERHRRVGEDAKLCHELVRAGVRSVATGLATLDYYMGGYSNRHVLTGEAAWDATTAGH